MPNIEKFDSVNRVAGIIADDVRKQEFKSDTERHIEEIKQLIVHIKMHVLKTENTDIEALHYWLDAVLTTISIEQFQRRHGGGNG